LNSKSSGSGEKSKVFAYPVNAPYSGTVIIRATIKVTEPIKKNGKLQEEVYRDIPMEDRPAKP